MRRSKAEIYLHLVWTTRQRQPWIKPEIERAIHRCIEKEARRCGCEVLAINGMSDHIHIAVKLPTPLAPAHLANQIKGVSSHFVHEQLPGNEAFAWQEGYGVFSFSRNQSERVIAYIDNQKRHHAEGSLHAEWEETDEEYVPKQKESSSEDAEEGA